MKISEVLKTREVTISIEMFPPKQWDGLEKVRQTVGRMAALSPDFISVTYGAGGGASDYTIDIARDVQTHGVPVMAHLTCVSPGQQKIDEVIGQLQQNGIENVLALRGDLPQQSDFVLPEGFAHATDIIAYLKKRGDFCIGGACYPEGHPEAASPQKDLDYLKLKQDLGVDFLTTQLFFDNELFYEFRNRAEQHGITVPIIAGVMPIVSAAQIKRTLAMSASRIPLTFRRLLDKYSGNPVSMRQAGILFAVAQISDLLACGQRNIHLYAMNRPDVAGEILMQIRPLLAGQDAAL